MQDFKIGKYDIPFDANGDLVDDEWRGIRSEFNWVANSIFKDTLRFVGVNYRGNFEFKNDMNKKVQMFACEIDRLVPLMVNGVLTGTFCYRKKGNSYGIEPIFDDLYI